MFTFAGRLSGILSVIMSFVYHPAVTLILLLSQASPAAEGQQGTPVVVPRATQYDLKSKITGMTYRVMVATPPNADPAVAYPVLYVLDGNAYFATASEALTRQSASTVSKAIVVGVGYPTDDRQVYARLRYLDLTPSVSKKPMADGVKTGGGDAFLRVMEEEVKPFVMARFKVDPRKQIIFGHSIAGMMVLRCLFRNPGAYSVYILSSPSIWYNDKEVLADEAAFSRRGRNGDLQVNVLVTSASDEQYRGDDAKLRTADTARMVDNASELADRLGLLHAQNIQVARVIFAGETHNTVPLASLSRALRFALPVK